MIQNGWIKLHRKILSYPWYKDDNTMRVFFHLLLTANIDEQRFKGDTIHRGELVTSISTIKNELGLTDQKVRTALKHLKSTGTITSKQRSKYSIITIVNYDFYQGELTGSLTANQQAANKQLTGSQQAANKQSNNNIRNIRNKRREERKNKEERTPEETERAEECFNQFWERYPNKTGRGAAREAFLKINPDQETFSKIISAIESMSKTEAWTEEGGRYIPNPAKWLQEERWNDDAPKPRTKTVTEQRYDQRPNTEPDGEGVPRWLQEIREKGGGTTA